MQTTCGLSLPVRASPTVMCLGHDRDCTAGEGGASLASASRIAALEGNAKVLQPTQPGCHGVTHIRWTVFTIACMHDVVLSDTRHLSISCPYLVAQNLSGTFGLRLAPHAPSPGWHPCYY